MDFRVFFSRGFGKSLTFVFFVLGVLGEIALYIVVFYDNLEVVMVLMEVFSELVKEFVMCELFVGEEFE